MEDAAADSARAAGQLESLLAAIRAGELEAEPVQIGYLRGAVAALLLATDQTGTEPRSDSAA